MPVYNSARGLPEFVQRTAAVLAELASEYEIIFVNDGSRDDSWAVIQALAGRHVGIVGLNLMRNYGQHNALLAGILQARGDFVVTMDDDLQHPPEELPKLLAAALQGADVVYGKPQQRSHSLWRNFGSFVIKRGLRVALGAEMAQKSSAFRLFRAELRAGFVQFRDAQVSIDVLLSWGASRVVAVEVAHHSRKIGSSGYTLRKLMSLTFAMVTGYSSKPLRMASTLGIAAALIGLSMFAYVVAQRLTQPNYVPGFAFLAGSIALFSGLQLFTMGILGEYLARVHFRTMGKPTFVVRSRLESTAVAVPVSAPVDAPVSELAPAPVAAAPLPRPRLLVLGAAAAQVPLIAKAKALGFEVLVASTPGAHPGFALADRHFEIDIRDREALLRLARREAVVGVLSDQTDVGVPSVAYVAQQLGLPGIGADCAEVFTDKLRMREVAKAHGVPVPAYVLLYPGEPLERVHLDVPGPWVVKPVDSQGSRGVCRVDAADGLPAAIEAAFAASPSRRVLVEQFFEGVELVVEGFASNGGYWTLGIGDRRYFDSPGLFIPKSTLFPSALPAALLQRIEALNEQFVRALAPRFAITHGEYLVNPQSGEICLVEIAARGGGAFISSDLVPYVSGVDLGALLVAHASGQVRGVELSPAKGRAAGYFSFELPAGIVEAVEGLEAARRLPGVMRLDLGGLRVGQRVRALRDKTDRIGPLVVVGEDRDDCLRNLQRVQETLRVSVCTDQGLLQTQRW